MAVINDMDCEPQVARHPQTSPLDLQPHVPCQEEARGRKEKRRHVLMVHFLISLETLENRVAGGMLRLGWEHLGVGLGWLTGSRPQRCSLVPVLG